MSSSPVVVVGVDSGTKGGPTDPTTALSHLTAEVFRGEERAGDLKKENNLIKFDKNPLIPRRRTLHRNDAHYL